MKALKSLSARFEAVMSAVSFAEAGEFETAREILQKRIRPQDTLRKRPEQKHTPRLVAKTK